MAQAAIDFLRVLAAACVRDGDPAELAAQARVALDGVFAAQKSLVLDVQFTGFTQKGQLVGGVDPALLRAAGQLIVLRVTRIGFTPDAAEEGLAALFRLVGQGPGALPGGIVTALREAAPAGIYLTTSAGETYRPTPAAAPAETPAPSASAPAEAAAPAAPAAPAEPAEPAGTVEARPPAEVQPAAETTTGEMQPEPPSVATPPAAVEPPAAEASAEATAPDASADEPAVDVQPAETPVETPTEAPPAPAAAASGSEADPFAGAEPATELSEFEVLDAFPVVDPAGGHHPAAGAAASPGGGGRGGEPASHDMYHFFRTAAGPDQDAEAEELPGLLRGTDNVARFDDLAQSAVRAALRLLRADQPAAALALLDTLVDEAERPDRTRLFRDAATQALQRVAGSEGTLQLLGDLLRNGVTLQGRVVRYLAAVGGDAVPLLEDVLFRTADPELRRSVFRRLLALEGMGRRIMARAMADPAPGRTRAILELATDSSVDPDQALRWVGEAAGHADPTVRMDAARHAVVLGGRGGLRVLVDMLGDRERMVQRAALEGLGALGDPASIPFLSRLLGDSGDEELQVGAIDALGKTGSPEALPVLLAVVNRRSLFAGRRLTRVKSAAIAAMARIPSPAAREALSAIAAGKDSDLAPEARRHLDMLG